MESSFPYILVRLPAVPRSRLHQLIEPETRDVETVRLLQSQPFFDALMDSNPELATRVRKLKAENPESRNKKERQTIRAALRYLWRATLRPIPFGRLCGTALGRLTDQLPKIRDLTNRQIIETASGSRLKNIAQNVLLQPGLAHQTWLSLSPLCSTGNYPFKYWSSQSNQLQPVPEQYQSLVLTLSKCEVAKYSDLSEEFEEAILQEAIKIGLVEQHAAAPDEDEYSTLLALLWTELPKNLDLLPAILALTSNEEKDRHYDSFIPDTLEINQPGIDAFFEEISYYASIDPQSSQKNVSHHTHGSAALISLIDFYEKFRDQSQNIQNKLNFGEKHRRICFRYRRFSNGSNGQPRYHLSYFGGGQMSLLPRYERFPFQDESDFPKLVRSWFENWPDIWELYGDFPHDADFHEPVTQRTLQVRGFSDNGNIRLTDLQVMEHSPDGPFSLVDPDGNRIQPVFFGVSSEVALHPLVRFLLHLGNPAPSFLEQTCRALGPMVASELSMLGDSIRVIPEITLGETIVLSPRLWLIPSVSVPALKTPVSSEVYKSFHQWLSKENLPKGLAQAAVPGREPQCFDFRHPEGVNTFLRLLRSTESVILNDMYLTRDEDGLQAVEGWYEAEYYAELMVSGAISTSADVEIEEPQCAL